MASVPVNNHIIQIVELLKTNSPVPVIPGNNKMAYIWIVLLVWGVL